MLCLSLDHVLLRHKPHSVASLGNALKLIHQSLQFLGDLDGRVGVLIFVEGKLDETPELDSTQALPGHRLLGTRLCDLAGKPSLAANRECLTERVACAADAAGR